MKLEFVFLDVNNENSKKKKNIWFCLRYELDIILATYYRFASCCMKIENVSCSKIR